MRQYEITPMGHVWKVDEDGELDIFGYEVGDYHNGPVCINCGYGFCHHCQNLPTPECTEPKVNEQ